MIRRHRNRWLCSFFNQNIRSVKGFPIREPARKLRPLNMRLLVEVPFGDRRFLDGRGLLKVEKYPWQPSQTIDGRMGACGALVAISFSSR